MQIFRSNSEGKQLLLTADYGDLEGALEDGSGNVGVVLGILHWVPKTKRVYYQVGIILRWVPKTKRVYYQVGRNFDDFRSD
jgi:hypothetical protein